MNVLPEKGSYIQRIFKCLRQEIPKQFWPQTSSNVPWRPSPKILATHSNPHKTVTKGCTRGCQAQFGEHRLQHLKPAAGEFKHLSPQQRCKRYPGTTGHISELSPVCAASWRQHLCQLQSTRASFCSVLTARDSNSHSRGGISHPWALSHERAKLLVYYG